MSDRCIVAARFTPAGSPGLTAKAVGGFLRYVQHRDLHAEKTEPKVAGLVKYIAYRDQANTRAELFTFAGKASSEERKAFAAFVVRSLAESRPQLYRNRQGETADRRRAVYRLVISPERAAGLDLALLTRTAVASLEEQIGDGRLRWLAAIHRNTAHPHVHLVVAGMRESADSFSRVELTKPRLAGMKAAVALEIERQRGERQPSRARSVQAARRPVPSAAIAQPRLQAAHATRHRRVMPRQPAAVLRLRAAARRYRRQAENDATREARQRGWERAA